MQGLSKNWIKALNKDGVSKRNFLTKGEQDKQRCFHQFAETSAPSTKTTAKGR